jgi:excinuclease ABC subunit A
VVEHNLDVIKTADWVIDMGPEGGAGGGCLLAAGIPETIAECETSHTGRALRKVLQADAERAQPGSRTSKARRLPATQGRRPAPFDVSRPIVVQGASQHNLQNVDIELPRHQMSVFCGPSGSGKSSLAMDTLYAEGQRRYVESLSAYARQFLGQMPKPRVEHVSGLSPAIAIEQKTVGNTPRSTVGTVTEIYDYLRILFARLGQPFCPQCDLPVATQTTDQVIEQLLARPAQSRLLILAPQEVAVGDSYDRLWDRLRGQGWRRVRVNGETTTIDEVPDLDRRSRHQVEIVVDRITLGPSARKRLAESVEKALDLGRGVLKTALIDDQRPETDWQIDTYSLHRACHRCGQSYEALSPNNFSFNSMLGWCGTCEGLGTQQGTDLAALVGEPHRTLAEGVVTAWPDPRKNRLFSRLLAAVAQTMNVPLDVPFERLDARHKRIILFGTGDRWIEVPADAQLSEPGFALQYKGLYPVLDDLSRISFQFAQRLSQHVGEVPCPGCQGSRLRPDAAAVRFADRTLQEVVELPLGECLEFLKGVKLKPAEKKIAGDLLREVLGRLGFLVDVGLHYLTLSRTMPTLSGGESQRIRLAGQVGRSLTGVLYVLDEPTIGLHPRDNGRLLKALRQLRDLGNTVVLVEHDREVLDAADRLYDFGPGAGRFGGTIVGQGAPRELKKSTSSLTGKFLSGREQIAIPTQRRLDVGSIPGESSTPGGGWLELLGCTHHNLHDSDLRIPLGTLTCVTGVSGSGKSSLIEDTLARVVARRLHGQRETPGKHRELKGLQWINKVITVDQQPLGTTPASNPATYTGVFDLIRELFARLPEAKVRGFRPARFSFNRPGGRCEACEGNGQKKIEMHFLPDVWVTCDDCRGKRFNAETLAVTYHGNSIADVLEMSIGQAAELFANIPKVRAILSTLCAVGLDYLTLGQSAATLSGGEAQRVKLASELARPQTGRTLYILDEPTTGLHFDDIRKLLKVLHSLVQLGNTVVVIEHNLDVIKTADWIVDIGPEAGADGGWVVAEGTPEEVADTTRWPRHTYTGELLAPLLQRDQRAELELFDAKAVSRKKQGDLEIEEVGKSTRMPWQTDGRRWHLETRLTHVGTPCQWEGPALEAVIRQIEEHGAFAIDWSERSIVDVRGVEPRKHWFLHAMTGDEWILKLKFRVPGAPFRQERLDQSLALRSFDDIDEVPVYGRADRVQVKRLEVGWQEIEISVHWLREIDTPAFREFLGKALEVYSGRKPQGKPAGSVGQTTKLKTGAGTEPPDPPDLPQSAAAEGKAPAKSRKKGTGKGRAQPDAAGALAEAGREGTARSIADEAPWKKLGRAWHEKRRGFPADARIVWPVELVALVMDLVERTFPGETWAFDEAECARMSVPDVGTLSVYTKRPEGVELVFQPLAKRKPILRETPGKMRKDATALPNKAFSWRFTTPQEVAALVAVMLKLRTTGL